MEGKHKYRECLGVFVVLGQKMRTFINMRVGLMKGVWKKVQTMRKYMPYLFYLSIQKIEFSVCYNNMDVQELLFHSPVTVLPTKFLVLYNTISGRLPPNMDDSNSYILAEDVLEEALLPEKNLSP